MLNDIRLLLILSTLAPLVMAAQTPAASPCENTPAYSPCELVFELPQTEAAAHPNPYLTVELRIEFRSPRHRTYALPAFWDGGQRMVVRFAPVEAGAWDYLISSNINAWNGKTGSFTAAASDAPGFIRPASIHHWTYTERNRAHLWMGSTELGFADLEENDFRAVADARAAQKFNHLRGYVTRGPVEGVLLAGGLPNPAWFQKLDRRVGYLNGKGIIADLILAPEPGDLAKMFPSPAERRRFARYLAARYSAMNITWQAVQQFEGFLDARALLKEFGTEWKASDPYQHPRSSGARITSAPLLDDGWMNFAAYRSPDNSLGSIEHQIFPVPFVNLEFAREDSGAGKSSPNDVAADEMRRRLWNATMNGQYVTHANTGSGGKFADSPGARQMTVWFDFMSGTRHWELEPYFDVDGGRALALEDTEYIVYIEKPGPLELLVEKHGYDVYWINPADGQSIKGKKFSGDHFTGEPPDRTHDWVLHVLREGRMEGMARSYRFESRDLDSRAKPIAIQEIESSPGKVPFEVEQPTGDLKVASPAAYSARIVRATRATRAMMWLWTGEVARDGQGYRVLATSEKGTLQPPADLARTLPATLMVRIYGMNANGKVYSVDRATQLNK